MGKKCKVKLDVGTVYQKEEGGTYYFRYQVQHERKCVSLKTSNQEEALEKARKLLPIIQATTEEVISAHVKVARHLVKQARPLPLSEIWNVYSKHPQRAIPATVREELAYHSTLDEMIRYFSRYSNVKDVKDVTPALAEDFANHLRSMQISVATHNRKIVRIRRIFGTLKDYLSIENPFG